MVAEYVASSPDGRHHERTSIGALVLVWLVWQVKKNSGKFLNLGKIPKPRDLFCGKSRVLPKPPPGRGSSDRPVMLGVDFLKMGSLERTKNRFESAGYRIKLEKIRLSVIKAIHGIQSL